MGILHLIMCCPDTSVLNVGKNDVEILEKCAENNKKDFLLTPENCHEIEDLYDYLATIKTTCLLLEWIDETREDIICDQFGIGPGDIFRHVEAIQWLLYSTTQIASLFMHRKLTFDLENLRTRVHYGIKEELLKIITLKGVGRIRARNLYDKGYKTLDHFKSSSVDQLAQVPTVGKTLAQDILKQIANPPNAPIYFSKV